LDQAENLGNIINYSLFRKGPLTSNIAEAGAFLKTDRRFPVPDLEVLFGPAYYMSHGFSNPKGPGFSFGPIVLHPESRGEITLRSKDPFEAPAIQPNYLNSEADLQILIDGVKLSREIAHTKAFAPFRGNEVWPGPNVRTDLEIAKFICNTVESVYHPVGTCRMGDDPMAVVDSKLRVQGVGGIRIADASVMPTPISGHPNAATMMIAERAADLIKAGF
jgi:choline dehydrogenase